MLDGQDRYRRTLARLSPGGRDVGTILVREGLALPWQDGPKVKEARRRHGAVDVPASPQSPPTATIPPMTLGNMREHGVRSVQAHCQESGCGHSDSLNVDGVPDDYPVPDIALRLRCSRCGSRNVKTQPDWREGE